MSYSLEISENADSIFRKLSKKNPRQLNMIDKKVLQIQQDPYRFKPLKGDMHGARRVHIDKSFVLIYEIIEGEKMVKILDYNHHDKIY